MWASHLYFRTNDGSGCGNDGGVSWLPPPRRGGRVSNPPLQAGTAVRQQHRLPAGGHVGPPLRLVTRASPHRIPHPHRAGEGGFQTRPYRRERLSASNIAYRRADTWVRPYGWSRAHPPHPIPLPPVTRGEGVRCELSGCVVGFGVYQGGERPGVAESMGAP